MLELKECATTARPLITFLIQTRPKTVSEQPQVVLMVIAGIVLGLMFVRENANHQWESVKEVETLQSNEV